MPSSNPGFRFRRPWWRPMVSAPWTFSTCGTPMATKSRTPNASRARKPASLRRWKGLEPPHPPPREGPIMTTAHKQLVLSGMQPTNTLHLGNYLGALKNWVRMQTEMPCLFCVVDMHAITQSAGYAHRETLTHATREVTAAYIAAGVDPKRTPIFNQAQVPEHAELTWILDCVARLGWL